MRETVHLVEDEYLWTLVQVQLPQNIPHDLELLGPVRMRDVDHVQQQIRLTSLFERRAEGRD